jgi:acyl-CoA thioesterase
MEGLKQYFDKDALAKHLGIELVEISAGAAVARMPVRPHHLNSHGMVHGAAIFALADFAFAAASNSHGTVAVALSASILFVKAGGPGTLTARASEVSMSPKIGTYAITVTDDSGDIVASFQGQVYRKRDPIACGA